MFKVQFKLFLVATIAVVAAALCWGSPAQAEDPVHWDFDVFTDGSDESWTSPTALDAGSPAYEATLFIEHLYVETFGVLPRLDLASLFEGNPSTETFPGPFPIVLYADSLDEGDTYADVEIVIDAAGVGQMALTNVTLGNLPSPLPDVPIQSIQFLGTIDVAGVPEPSAVSLLIFSGIAMLVARRRR